MANKKHVISTARCPGVGPGGRRRAAQAAPPKYREVGLVGRGRRGRAVQTASRTKCREGNKWRTAEGEEQVDLSKANLFGLDLSCINLSGANLNDTILAKTNLSGASLDGADLSRADLSHANLERASLRNANLSGGVNLSDTNLSGASPSLVNPTATSLSFLLWRASPMYLRNPA